VAHNDCDVTELSRLSDTVDFEVSGSVLESDVAVTVCVETCGCRVAIETDQSRLW